MALTRQDLNDTTADLLTFETAMRGLSTAATNLGEQQVFAGLAEEARNFRNDLRGYPPDPQADLHPGALLAVRAELVTITNMTQHGLRTATADSAAAFAALAPHERDLRNKIRQAQVVLGLRTQ